MTRATYSIQRMTSDPQSEYGPSHGDVRIAIIWNYANRVVNGWADHRSQEALETVAERLSAEHDQAVAAGTAPTRGDLRISIRGGKDDPEVIVGYFHGGASHDGPSDAVLLDLGKRAFKAIDRAI